MLGGFWSSDSNSGVVPSYSMVRDSRNEEFETWTWRIGFGYQRKYQFPTINFSVKWRKWMWRNPDIKDSSIETVDVEDDHDLKPLNLFGWTIIILDLTTFCFFFFFFFFFSMNWLTSLLYMSSLLDIWISSLLCNILQSRNILIPHAIWRNNLTWLPQTKESSMEGNLYINQIYQELVMLFHFHAVDV